MFGGDDFFDRVAREFFSENSDLSGTRPNASSVSKDQNSIVSNLNVDYDRIEGGDDYFITVIFGDIIKKADLDLSIEDDFNSEDRNGGIFGGADKVLSIYNKGKNNSFLKIRIPKKIAKKSMSFKLNNGILEVRFGK